MSLLENLVGIISPPVCINCGIEGAVICHACTSVIIKPFGSRCYLCNRLSSSSKTCTKCMRFGGPSHMWISTTYKDAPERLIELYKFGCHRPAGQALAKLMAQNLAEQTLPVDCLVVPVPTATSRIRERSFDHAALLARQIARHAKLEYSPALGRLGQSRQVGASRSQRLSQTLKSYRIVQPNRIVGRNILLVDDVATTGATIQSVTKILRTSGARSINALVFAKRL